MAEFKPGQIWDLCGVGYRYIGVFGETDHFLAIKSDVNHFFTFDCPELDLMELIEDVP